MIFFIFFVYINTLNRGEIFEKYEIIKKIIMLTLIWSTFYIKTDIYIYIYIYIYYRYIDIYIEQRDQSTITAFKNIFCIKAVIVACSCAASNSGPVHTYKQKEQAAITAVGQNISL